MKKIIVKTGGEGGVCYARGILHVEEEEVCIAAVPSDDDDDDETAAAPSRVLASLHTSCRHRGHTR